ncbi:aspartate kinase [Pleomassaria siparia CBS 279.74]|uniref:Aspartokinase n=1 Tax=Pleomassaria siparia CBS 279.74 TaxID=1314801 RepID=A0A6G1KDX6_9PLEO|nr:aspartate kinase [Pleomassaria siparia CBS 279.74]
MPELDSKPWIVQKYGGTSIGKLLDTIHLTIIPKYLLSYNVAVVCSARSTTSKSEGTTSLLIDAVRLATSSDTKSTDELDDTIDRIKNEHLSAAKEAIDVDAGVDLLLDVETAIRKDCERMRVILKATWTLGEISERTSDRVLAVGETLSCRILAASLRSRGIAAQEVILDDIVEAALGRGHLELSRAYKASPSGFLRALTPAIQGRLLACKGKVPVITDVVGFFGSMPDSLISCVGRGYSDLCAALCAVALTAEELQIWKEVDGIFSADPRKIKAARLLGTITSEEASELTYYGSEVIHPLTIEQIDVAGIPLRLKNVVNPEGSGTIIYPSKSSCRPSGSCSPVAQSFLPINTAKANFMLANGYHGEAQARRTPTACTTKEGITVLNFKSNGISRPQSFLARVGEILERHNITIDLISSSQQMLSLAVSSTRPQDLKAATKAFSHLGTATAVPHMSIVSVVGHKMKNVVGIAGEIFDALATARVNIYLISQGASEINISIVVKAQDSLLALHAIHSNVMRIPLQSEKENSFIRGPWLY